MLKLLQCPFPWFGGKSRVGRLVWERFGRVARYIEPFAGSLAVLLARPNFGGLETVNDRDGFLCNFWRAVAADPDRVAYYADWPVNENDLHARHAWLAQRRKRLTARLEGDPAYYSARIAGWWVWGISCWIGGHWCVSGQGPWVRVRHGKDDWRLERGAKGSGITRRRPEVTDTGKGVCRKRPHLTSAGQGVCRVRPSLGMNTTGLLEWFRALQQRLRQVRVCCGDWSRVVQPAILGPRRGAITAVFLDPPYAVETGRDAGLYAEDSSGLSKAVGNWARTHAAERNLRIALCGYVGEHHLPEWSRVRWTGSGYGAGKRAQGDANRYKECIWFSPSCLNLRLV